VFGDKAMPYQVDGIAFDTKPCKGKKQCSAKDLLDFYDAYKLSYDKGDKVADQVVITAYNALSGDTVKYTGLLIRMSLRTTTDPNGARQYIFSFTFLSIE